MLADRFSGLSHEEITNYGNEIVSAASNLYKLLENLLQWSLMQEGATDFNPREFEMGELIMQNVEIIKAAAEQKEISISFEGKGDCPAFADEKMIHSVMRNLLSNAVKFTRRGGEVRITLQQKGKSFVEVLVADNGIGIPGELQKKLFRTDTKSGRVGTEGESSTGLGLLLCKEFIEKNGGTISVESEEGKGSTFGITIPKPENI
jgi:signal transduction histidine kinase